MKFQFKNYWLNTAPEYILKTWWIKIHKETFLAAKWAYSFYVFGLSMTIMSNQID